MAGLFAEADKAEPGRPQGPDLDRSRGRIVFEARDGRYEKGAHFGRWFWPDFTGERWGSYRVKLSYASAGPRQGFQFFVGDRKAKGYLVPTGGLEQERTADLGRLALPDRGTYPVGILAGDEASGPGFQLRRVVLEPAPEGEAASQAIDGTLALEAGSATTYSRLLRCEPAGKKDWLGSWTELADWVEWLALTHEGGRFQVELSYGCGGGNHGSEVALWVNDARFSFLVEDTGGFQVWKQGCLGEADLPEGQVRVVVKPVSKAAGEILNLRQVTFTPVKRRS